MSEFLLKLNDGDLVALVVLFLSLFLYEPISKAIFGKNISSQMMLWRKAWATQMLWRHERITDVSLVRGLIHNVSFFATTTVFVISGLVALLGASHSITEKLNSFSYLNGTTEEAVVLKITSLLIIMVIAFFEFAWSMGLHANSLLMLGSAPEPSEKDSKATSLVVNKLSEMSVLASYHFQYGVRAYYFGISSLAWIIHPYVFYAVFLIVILIILRREFFSRAFYITSMEDIEWPTSDSSTGNR
ncbi:DUF599 domain-containing protein [Grimontia marina]|uniref:DUF599 domain-containing protein n=1 Tax=Grimontia marina TaxID=646534 RepID=A0A128F150_9GAMM|nr:DUF599 domain-containing protein [Grimontia marina]CZF80001.1 hypothetical protein GMA8713_01216 [Grimontia marina]